MVLLNTSTILPPNFKKSFCHLPKATAFSAFHQSDKDIISFKGCFLQLIELFPHSSHPRCKESPEQVIMDME